MESLGVVIYLLCQAIVMPAIGYACAAGENRGGLGALLGLLFGPIGIVIALRLPAGRRPRPRYEHTKHSVRVR